MTEDEQRMKELLEKIQALQSRHQQMSYEINDLLIQVSHLKGSASTTDKAIDERPSPQPVSSIPKVAARAITTIQQPVYENRQQRSEKSRFVMNETVEDFIGTNLISKIGILITIIGVFIGAKYAIDKDLISPTMRIILGYAAGGVLIFTALRLKKKYENFSAVLMGGGLAVMYFITYVSYNFYQLLPQSVAFLVMIAITACTVYIALWYNLKIIAILGQVAAYAIPFLLSDGSGKIMVLFTYISVINIGLLVLSFKRNWKVLYRIAFALTWIIYFSWSVMREPEVTKFSTGIIFWSINFLTFYATFLAYKIVRKELYNLEEVLLLLINALLFFFLGAALINSSLTATHALTYFTICNAAIHLVVGYLMFKMRLADRSVFQFIIGLGFLFVTIAVPVELNGSWVTLLWTIEATILSYIGIRNNRSLFLIIAVPMICVAALSLLQDWADVYYQYGVVDRLVLTKSPFLHLTFWFSLFTASCFGLISWKYYKTSVDAAGLTKEFFNRIMPALFIIVLYLVFFNEIQYVGHFQTRKVFNPLQKQGIEGLCELSLYIYSFIFVSLMLLVDRIFIDSNNVRVLLTVSVFAALLFLINGLSTIGELRQVYLKSTDASFWLLSIRYVCFVALFLMIVSARKSITQIQHNEQEKRAFTAVLNVVLLSVICNEFIHWMDLAGYTNQYKLGLSIICGLYALVLVFVGIRTKQKQLRVGAIILFAMTLLKLFFYDLQSLSSISKTIVLLILGVILLLVSFLYNKYKDVILGSESNTTPNKD